MIDIKQAVSIAIEFMKSLYDKSEILDLRLEEVELSDDAQYWLITLGFLRPSPAKHPFEAIAALGQPSYVRVYKVIKVNADTGDTMSMKIRSVS